MNYKPKPLGGTKLHFNQSIGWQDFTNKKKCQPAKVRCFNLWGT